MRSVLGNAHGEVTSIDVLPIEQIDRGLGDLRRRQLDKPETARSSGVSVGNDLGVGHFTVWSEKNLEIGRCRAEREVSDMEFGGNGVLPSK